MAIVKRVFLFLLTNFLVITTCSIFFYIFGIGNYLTQYGIDYVGLALFSLIYGMTGSIISLWMSRAIAKWSYGVQLIDERQPDPAQRSIMTMVHDLSRKAGLTTMPEVGIYASPDINAFATGPTKSRALVAVSTGLLERMNRDEVEGVLGHEISHIANGDMVTMTLLQGIVNAFAIFLSRAVAYAVTRNRDENSNNSLAYFIISFVLQTVFLLLGSIVVNWFSRQREFRADAGGASLAGKQAMIGALKRLESNYETMRAESGSLATMKISNRPAGLFGKLFSSHPPLEERIAALSAGS
ncbi:MAG TPA: protease HtpX [Candidatus Obscuribacter sp.]|nr:protease HtpX [Candidatus Obscuribacter sp.]